MVAPVSRNRAVECSAFFAGIRVPRVGWTNGTCECSTWMRQSRLDSGPFRSKRRGEETRRAGPLSVVADGRGGRSGLLRGASAAATTNPRYRRRGVDKILPPP